MSAELLERTGRALYGQQWQSDLARDIGVSDRTVRNWAAGTAMKASAWAQIQDICLERVGELATVVKEMRR